jgi:hypothetical protein
MNMRTGLNWFRLGFSGVVMNLRGLHNRLNNYKLLEKGLVGYSSFALKLAGTRRSVS